MATVMTPTTGLEAEVLRADDRRFEAMKQGDWAALDDALADDLGSLSSRLPSGCEKASAREIRNEKLAGGENCGQWAPCR
jgi:hypothetical protein